MRIKLVLPSMGISYTMNHGITAISAAINLRGDECSLIHIDNNYQLERVVKEIEQDKPDVIGVSLTENHWLQMQALAHAVKKRHNNILIFFGGPFPSAYPQVIEECESIDGLCIGEGEVSFVELLNKIEAGKDYQDTKGFWFRVDEDIIRNPMASLIDNLDDLPMPYIQIHNMRAIKNYPSFSFSRGCPFKCTYCCAPLYQKRTNQVKVRYKSPSRAILEIKNFLSYYDAPRLNFDDDTFIKSKKWLHEFLDLYSREIHKPFACNTRPETINDEVVSMLKEANCEYIFLGIESGDEHLRDKVLGRGRILTNRQIIDSFKIIKKYGIHTFSFNMVGIPGETPEAHQRTIDLNRIIQPDRLQITVFYPYRGTVLGDEAYRQGLVREQGNLTYFGRTILSIKEFTKKQIEKSARLFRYRVFKKSNLWKALYYYLLDGMMCHPRLYNMIFKIYKGLVGRFAISEIFIRPEKVEITSRKESSKIVI